MYRRVMPLPPTWENILKKMETLSNDENRNTFLDYCKQELFDHTRAYNIGLERKRWWWNECPKWVVSPEYETVMKNIRGGIVYECMYEVADEELFEQDIYSFTGESYTEDEQNALPFVVYPPIPHYEESELVELRIYLPKDEFERSLVQGHIQEIESIFDLIQLIKSEKNSYEFKDMSLKSMQYALLPENDKAQNNEMVRNFDGTLYEKIKYAKKLYKNIDLRNKDLAEILNVEASSLSRAKRNANMR